MNFMLIENRIINILTENLGISTKKNSNPESFKWDSLKHITLMSVIEEEFDILLEPEEISEMLNYKDIVKVVKLKLTHTDQL